ncbi:STP22 [Candida oxycetoniae]|uniref:STP22 n=1 Tax=Candida oxycetoniae TaxID=497107 RepID=A0AAI9SV64_9ASCO|nr:STP22 [Candida oxycetoniae]KAI3403648.2 STP22 [Candida oxycetoniae]
MSLQQLPQSVSNWLFNVIQPSYIYKQIVYNNVYHLLQLHLKKNFNFRIRTKVYTDEETGESCLLLNLFKTILIDENISVPIEIWIPFTYPYSDFERQGVPLVYIVPDHSKNWFLKPSNNVDSQGKFYHPYLSAWHREYTESNFHAGELYNLNELANIVHQSVLADPPILNRSPILSSGAPPPKPAKVEYGKSSFTFNRYPQNEGQLFPLETSGPSLPEKPPKITLANHTSSQYTGNSSSINIGIGSSSINTGIDIGSSSINTGIDIGSSSINTGIDIGSSSINTGIDIGSNSSGGKQPPPIPLKYQAPLPIPDQYTKTRQPPPPDTPSTQVPVAMLQTLTINERQNFSPPSLPMQKVEPVDLVDSDNPQVSSISAERKMALEKLSERLNQCFESDPIHQSIAFANENVQKANALYSQLSHHYQQAKENSKNLDGHIQYLSTILTNITDLNKELTKLNEQNNHAESKVVVNSKCDIPLDELIVPDSLLVKQLYEVVSEIKAIKDTMNLISGNFHSCSEIINDKNQDFCVKTMRNLGRELFWLELTKNEIANIMKLQTIY